MKHSVSSLLRNLLDGRELSISTGSLPSWSSPGVSDLILLLLVSCLDVFFSVQLPRWLLLELGNENLFRPSLFKSMDPVQGCRLPVSAFYLSHGKMGALAPQFST